MKIAGPGLRGSIFVTRSDETNTSTIPEIIEPSSRKGTPSNKTLRNAFEKSPKEKLKLLVNQSIKVFVSDITSSQRFH
jgi:hypothetical protein